MKIKNQMEDNLIEQPKCNLVQCGGKTNGSCNDMRLIEFIQDLKEAIQNGEFNKHEKQHNRGLAQDEVRSTESAEPDPQSISAISSLINVNNLSNQTFSYIINWLKQQQTQIEESRVSIHLSPHMIFFCFFLSSF